MDPSSIRRSDRLEAARRRRSALLRNLLCGAIAFVLTVAVFSGWIGITARNKHETVVHTLGNLFIPKPQHFFGKDRLNILVVGIDYDYDAKDQEFSKNSRTDMIMAISLNLPTAAVPKPSASIISIPRDMLATMPNGRQDKINGAFSLGGPKMSEQVIADFLGLPGFDRYAVLRINQSKLVIDAIGGVDMRVKEKLDYDDSWGHLHIHFKPGMYHMNGEQAISYARFRHDATGDVGRIARQQQLVKVVVNKIKGQGLNDLMHIKPLIDAINKLVQTDLKTDEEMSLANALAGFDIADLRTEQLPYTTDRDLACCGNVLIADEGAKLKLVKKAFLEPILSPSEPLDPTAIATIPASTIRVEIRNGSGEPGLGKKMATRLKKQGFKIGTVANAESFGYDTTEIRVHSEQVPLAGERVKTAVKLPKATVTTDVSTIEGDERSDVTVVVGRDFITGTSAQASAVK